MCLAIIVIITDNDNYSQYLPENKTVTEKYVNKKTCRMAGQFHI
ncbi:hypothetical protein VPH184E373B_0285 [Vibrio phage 184E37-3b]|nr:hypothetical protein MYOV056v2_p0248 [Vibrio phage 184E37.3a]QZI87150.1 hypothetical protein MYOV085v1_p0131 [Vibrio phage 355E48.1]QZI90056.1 hypothetical protein MYOV057v1_p0141 [Vibrio phage 184E37.1]